MGSPVPDWQGESDFMSTTSYLGNGARKAAIHATSDNMEYSIPPSELNCASKEVTQPTPEGMEYLTPSLMSCVRNGAEDVPSTH